MNQSKYTEEQKSEYIDLAQFIELLLSKWKWFVVGVGLMLFLAFIYLKRATPLYVATSTIMLKDDQKGGITSESNAISDIDIWEKIKTNIQNEREILLSRTLTEKVVSLLKLNISYFDELSDRADLYKKSPIVVDLQSLSPKYKNSVEVTVQGIDEAWFQLYFDKKIIGKYKYNELINNELGNFKIIKDSILFQPSYSVTTVMGSIPSVASAYRSALKISFLGKDTSILELSVTNADKQKAEDFLAALITLYNEESIADRRYISQNTSDFLTQRLDVLAGELTQMEISAENFKKQNQVTDIISEAGIYVRSADDFERQHIQVSTRIELIDNVIRGFLDVNTTGRTFPMLDALNADYMLSQAIDEHNKLVLLRNEMATNAGEENYSIKQMDLKIDDHKRNIKENLLLLKSNFQIQKADIEKQQSVINQRISSIPTLERQYRGVTRQQGVKDALYLYLLEKREETEISMVSLAPNAKVIDRPLASDIPVSPKKQMIYIVAFAIGLLVPALFIFLMNIFDTKIKKRADLENHTLVPFLGEVPHNQSNSILIKPEENTSFAEAVHIVRTNMDFILSGVADKKCKTIFVTSSVMGEGKTLISLNIAASFAISGKKTLLIEMDIRSPKWTKLLKMRSIGLTNYLASSDIDINSVITKLPDYKNLYAIPAKVVPPNPTELLMTPKVTEMFEQLREQYDYIIVDTAPVSLVADTLLTAKHADAFIYVLRERYSDKKTLQIPNKLYKENKLPNLSILLNDVQLPSKYNYGYSYGYGYVESKRHSFLRRILHKLRIKNE